MLKSKSFNAVATIILTVIVIITLLPLALIVISSFAKESALIRNGYSFFPEEWSLDENEERQPYSEYTLNIEAEGFESISVSGTEILANTKAIQNIRMKQKDQSREEEQVFVIPAHTLYGNYPPKIAEEEIKPVNETGEIVLSRVVVPEYIIVHDGSPRDSTAQNYYVKYKDYIKNVASSEIYATWPADTIRANVLAIMSFTLNRVYTEWSLRIWSLRVAEVYFLMN